MNTKRVETLSQAQKELLTAKRNEWMAIGLSTEPAGRDAAEAAARTAYRTAGLPEPKIVIWMDNPLHGAIAQGILRSKVWAQVRAQVRDQVRAQVGDQVRAQVWAQVRDQVRAQVGAQVRDQVRDQVGQAVYGSHEAPWLAFYEFFMRHFDLAKKANGLMAVAKACGWVWPFAGCAIITDRPAIISMDDQNRLHRADGPAIEYRDGFAVHAWHGVRIPSEWIDTPEALDAKSAVTWPNVEQRRAAIEILGWNRVLDALEAKSLGGNPDPKIGELIEVHLPFEDGDGNDATRALFLRAKCGTGRTIFEAVDPDGIDLDPRFDPAWCAQAWRDGYAPADWLPPSFRT